MDTKQHISRVTTFMFEGNEEPVSFVETVQVTDGVDCDVYTFMNASDKDLGIIRMKPGSRTPLQRVVKGDRTIEGSLSGKGKLTVTKPDGTREIFEADDQLSAPVYVTVAVNIGEIMQWESDMDTALVAYEVCFPPYEDGRYENIA